MKPNYRNLFLKKRSKFLESKYKTSFRQILSYLWDYKWIFIIDLIVGIFQSILFLTFPLYLGLSMDILVDPAIPIENMFPIFKRNIMPPGPLEKFGGLEVIVAVSLMEFLLGSDFK